MPHCGGKAIDMPFEKSFPKAMGIEGFYDFDPDDPGGETFMGIARTKHPSWDGWALVDAFKTMPGFPKSVPPALMEKVKQFYLEEFWNPLKCDLMPSDVADEVFDTAVNMGPAKAILFLQQALNLLNRNQTLYPDLKEDGKIGSKTLTALRIYLLKDTTAELIFWLNVLQGGWYAKIMRHNPTQEKYARGWSKRIVLTKLAA